MMYHLVKTFVIRWLNLICPEHYREAMIGDLLEAADSEKAGEERGDSLKLLWQVVLSTPSILTMRVRESHSKLNQQVIWAILVVGLSILTLERFVFGVVVWKAAEALSIQSIVMIRFMYLVVSIASVVGLCLLLGKGTKFKAGLDRILSEPIFTLYTMMLCFSYAWFTLLTHFSLDLFVFRIIQVCVAYGCMRRAIAISKEQLTL
jgi:hypothetical protein